MRPELRAISEHGYWVYGPRESDFEHTLTLARSLVASQIEVYRTEEARVRAAEPELADDILDDVAYYTHTDSQYVWHFALWRLQAILEALIVRVFLKRNNAKGLLGLSAKLAAMIDAGYEITSEDRNELEAWARVRNALSHAPPEQARPGPLTEEDVVEYKALVERLCEAWRDILGDEP